MKKGVLKSGSIVVGMTLVLSGCGLFGPDSKEIDPPQVNYENATESNSNLQIDLITGQTKEGTEVKNTAFEQRTLYFADSNGYVVPYGIAVAKVEGIAKESLSHMVAGSEGAQLLPAGFRALIPEGTTFTVDIDEGVATVDFSNEFLAYEAADEQRILDAITWSMTEFDNVKGVAIEVNGMQLTEMPVAGTPINGLLQRANGINLELKEGARVGQTSAVTVYFQGMTDDDQAYFVPVTRLIPRTDNITKATLEELVQGPHRNSQLTTSITPSTHVVSVEMNDYNEAVASLSKELLSFGTDGASSDALQSIVLSLTENSDVDRVYVEVDGMLVNGDNTNKPVSRPTVVNPKKL